MRELYVVGRVVGLDVGERRIGVAISDVTGTLARPLGVLQISGLDGDAVDRAVTELARLAAEEDGLASLVVGLPRRLDGSPNDMTPRVQAFAAALGARIGAAGRPAGRTADEPGSREPSRRARQGLAGAQEADRCGGRRHHSAGLSRRTVIRKLLLALIVIVVIGAVAGGLLVYELRQRLHEPYKGFAGRSRSSKSRRAPARPRSAVVCSTPASSPTTSPFARRCGGRAARARFRRASTASISRSAARRR